MLTKPDTSLAATLAAGEQVLIVAHRGEWSDAPENSLEAIRAAHAAGADIVEFDAQTIADGTLVVIHDETVDRTTNGAGCVADKGLAEIRSLNLLAGAGGHDAAPTQYRVPTLAEALEAARDTIFVNIDTKYPKDLDKVAATVLSLGMEEQVLLKGPVEIEGENRSILDASWFGRIPFMPILPARTERFAADADRIVRQFGAPMLEIGFDRLEDVRAARAILERLGARLWTNTLDVVHSLDFCDSRARRQPDAVWGTLIEAGISVFQTDISATLKTYLTERG